jgi:6,7-dimethyl-8-ribityllumazine synthase
MLELHIKELKMTSGWRVGVVTSRFNEEVTTKLEEGALKRLQELGAAPEQILRISVPGAVEIPLACQALLKKGCDGVIALGAVIRGETAHFDYVCRSVERGCSHVSLQFSKPVAFGVLTVENDEQAAERVGGKHGHKGREAAEVVVEMIQLLHELQV